MPRTQHEPVTWSTTEVCRLTGATYRQLDYWCRTGMIPGMPTTTGSGYRRRWTATDIHRAEQILAASRQINRRLAEVAGTA